MVVSYLSYETFTKNTEVSSLKNLIIKFKEDINSLDAVVINAGTFEANEKAKVTVLKPLDIVT